MSYEDQLVQFERPNETAITYQYAPVTKLSDELRLSTETDMGTVNFIWDNQNIIREIDETGTVEAEYTLNPQPYGNLVSQHRGAESSFYNFDALGSTESLTDPSATQTDSYAYTAFGGIAAQSGTTDNNFTWIGELGYFQDEPGSYSARLRIYESEIFRFLSQDPLGFAAGDENLYRYVGNNPLKFVDPSGKAVEIDCLCVEPRPVPKGLPYPPTPSQEEWRTVTCSSADNYKKCCESVCKNSGFYFAGQQIQGRWTGEWELRTARASGGSDTCPGFGAGAELGALNIAVAFTFNCVPSICEARDEAREKCTGVSATVQAISVASAGLARELLIAASGAKVAGIAAQGSKIARVCNLGFTAYDLYGTLDSLKGLLESESLFEAFINAGFLTIDIIGLGASIGETIETVEDLSRCARNGFRVDVKLKKLKSVDPTPNQLKSLDRTGDGVLTDADMDFLGTIDGQNVYQAADGSLWACSRCKMLSPDGGGGGGGSGRPNYRPSTKPSNAPPGTLPINQHPDTKAIVHDIKQRLREDGVGPNSYVGIDPDGNVIVTNCDGTAENLGHWSNYAN